VYYFDEEIEEAIKKHGLTPDSSYELLHDLAASFADVSYFANQAVPLAAPVSVEACLLGRSIVKKLAWFEIGDPEEMKERYGPDWSPLNRFSQYNGVEDPPQRDDRGKIDDKYLAPPDFWLSYRPGVHSEIANNDG